MRAPASLRRQARTRARVRRLDDLSRVVRAEVNRDKPTGFQPPSPIAPANDAVLWFPLT